MKSDTQTMESANIVGEHLNEHTVIDNSTSRTVLESQIRESYGKIVYSNKCQEKCADICRFWNSKIKLTQLILSAVTTGGLVATIFGSADSSRKSAIFSAICSTFLLALNTYSKENDFGQDTQKHKEAADKLWLVRETFFSLLTDIRAGEVTSSEIRAKRDDLNNSLGSIYTNAPRVFDRAYKKAKKALTAETEMTFSDGEIDKFLPATIKTNKAS